MKVSEIGETGGRREYWSRSDHNIGIRLKHYYHFLVSRRKQNILSSQNHSASFLGKLLVIHCGHRRCPSAHESRAVILAQTVHLKLHTPTPPSLTQTPHHSQSRAHSILSKNFYFKFIFCANSKSIKFAVVKY